MEHGGQLWAVDVYSDSVDLNETLTPELREAYKHNLLTPGMPAWVFVILSVVTWGVFGAVYLQLKQDKLPAVKSDDPSAAKAIGFMLIPLFNLYWYFVVWRRLVDRINFQYRLRGQPPPIDRGRSGPLDRRVVSVRYRRPCRLRLAACPRGPDRVGIEPACRRQDLGSTW